MLIRGREEKFQRTADFKCLRPFSFEVESLEIKQGRVCYCFDVSIICIWIFHTEAATAFYKLPKLICFDNDVCKIKGMLLPTNKFLLSRGIKNMKGTFLL